MHSGGFNKELSHCAARRRVTLGIAAEVGKSVTSRRSWRLVLLVCHSCVTIRECALISAAATSSLLFWADDVLVLVSFCSGPKQNQAGDSKLLSEVHPGGAGAVLQRHACDLLPV